ncbi:hypothetical protein DACRYDRAFT_59355 [Dacryopinax primogenitus]|uniref:Uncharacterized protein n=1 Tax=Dacryopinax primogenitus (strain DJM 731) TaxID=1858805 RepID=M5FPW1_DACPD|nr:uncharacterized protein DACRYDRAFT_59355 [Dacryopinax primogenitus]EJT97353.1 hypothetical protein DACRYDRAFT_59355 [Dacryopinax primogenitus]
MLQRDYNRVLHAIHEYEALASHYEAELRTNPWTLEHPLWQQYEAASQLREYHGVLDELETLVVQCIFELEKLSMRGTGYAMQTAIARALNARSKAIQSSLARYNKLASSLRPPRPVLHTEEVLDYANLADFSLLRFARDDIRAQRWADPRVREVVRKWKLVQCAEQELDRLNIEIRWVWTALHDEPAYMEPCIQNVEHAGDTVLASAMRRYVDRRLQGNARIQARLQEITALPGFTGQSDLGSRAGILHPNVAPGSCAGPQARASQAGGGVAVDWEAAAFPDLPEAGDPDDDVAEDWDRVAEALSSLETEM